MSAQKIASAEHRLSLLRARLHEQNEILHRLKGEEENVIWFTGPAAERGLQAFLKARGHGKTWELSTKYYAVKVHARTMTTTGGGGGGGSSSSVKAVVMVFGKGQFTGEGATKLVRGVPDAAEVRVCWIMDDQERKSEVSLTHREWCANSGVEFLEEEIVDGDLEERQPSRKNGVGAMMERLVDALAVAPWSNMVRKQVVVMPVVKNPSGPSRPATIPDNLHISQPAQQQQTSGDDSPPPINELNTETSLESLLNQMRTHKEHLQNPSSQMSDQERRDKAAALVMRMMASFMNDDEEGSDGEDQDELTT